MFHLRVKAKKFKYKEKDRRLKEPFKNGVNDDATMTEIIGELTVVKKNNKIISQKAFHWAKRVDAQRIQKAILNKTKKTKSLIY